MIEPGSWNELIQTAKKDTNYFNKCKENKSTSPVLV